MGNNLNTRFASERTKILLHFEAGLARLAPAAEKIDAFYIRSLLSGVRERIEDSGYFTPMAWESVQGEGSVLIPDYAQKTSLGYKRSTQLDVLRTLKRLRPGCDSVVDPFLN